MPSIAPFLLSIPLAAGGTVPILGAGGAVFTTNADHTLTAAEYQQQDVTVTSSVTLTATRNAVFPNHLGKIWFITNNVTGGGAIVATAGTSGVTIANGATAYVRCDGAGNLVYVVSATAGAGGWILNATATFSAHPAMSRALWQVQPVNTSGGAFTQLLPTGPTVGDLVALEDWVGTSTVTGIGANACTLSGTSLNIQNRHTMASAGTSYVWGAASGDAGGGVLLLRWTGTIWKVVG